MEQCKEMCSLARQANQSKEVMGLVLAVKGALQGRSSSTTETNATLAQRSLTTFQPVIARRLTQETAADDRQSTATEVCQPLGLSSVAPATLKRKKSALEHAHGKKRYHRHAPALSVSKVTTSHHTVRRRTLGIVSLPRQLPRCVSNYLV
jgi:hypothetical protein